MEERGCGSVGDRTDWERVEALTDEEIEQAVAEDPDAELLDAEWFRTAETTRINDVLKAYVLSQRLKEQREALEDDRAAE